METMSPEQIGSVSEEPGPLVQLEPTKEKFDNFYTPQNTAFYAKSPYVKFQSGERKIRLLRIAVLEPGQNDSSPIHAELVDDLSLDAMSNKFATISYAAGSPKNTEIVHVNGLVFNAFANLGHALRQARNFWSQNRAGKELLLWVDQLCIDQSNLNERSHQVGMMGDIYASAEEVLASLSVEGDPSGGVAWLLRFTAHATTLWENHPHRLFGNLVSNWLQDESNDRGWRSFASTIGRSHWPERAWIRQEFIRARDITFLAVFESIRWQILLKALRHGDHFLFEAARSTSAVKYDLCSLKTTLRPNHDGDCEHGNKRCPQWLNAYPVYSLCSARSHQDSLKWTVSPHLTPGRDFIWWLQDAYHFQASDPRDLFYSCFGLSNFSYSIFPNYSADVSEFDILSRIARAVIEDQGSLTSTLRWASRSRSLAIDHPPPKDIPSWAPDWRKFVNVAQADWEPLSYKLGPSSVKFLPNARCPSSIVLEVKGVRIDRLAYLQPTFENLLEQCNTLLQLLGYVASGSSFVYLLEGARDPIVLKQHAFGFTLLHALELIQWHGKEELPLKEIHDFLMSADPSVETVQIF